MFPNHIQSRRCNGDVGDVEASFRKATGIIFDTTDEQVHDKREIQLIGIAYCLRVAIVLESIRTTVVTDSVTSFGLNSGLNRSEESIIDLKLSKCDQ